jgi:hypothetical protein
MTRSGPRFYPAMWLYGLNAVLAVIVSFGVLSQAGSAWVLSLSTAVLGLITVIMTRPLDVPVFGAGIATILAAFAGFKYHLSPASISAVVVVFSMLAAYFTHQNVTPFAGSPTGQPLGVSRV